MRKLRSFWGFGGGHFRAFREPIYTILSAADVAIRGYGNHPRAGLPELTGNLFTPPFSAFFSRIFQVFHFFQKFSKILMIFFIFLEIFSDFWHFYYFFHNKSNQEISFLFKIIKFHTRMWKRSEEGVKNLPRKN
jgi:hypothetical protein